MAKPWFVYILRCADQTLYTGITTDLAARLTVHNQHKGAKYTRSRTPVTIVYSEKLSTESNARKREAALKKLSRQKKLAVIAAV